jgi:LmbE family N-acetylglucosaminyl deacetylase
MSHRLSSLIFLSLISSGTRRLPTVKTLVRRALSRAIRLVLRCRARTYGPDGTGVMLVLAPHPDDEVLGCGGLMARKRLEGAPVHVAYLTDGSESHPGHPTLTPEAMAETREGEARRAMRLLGVESTALVFLKARDGTLAHLDPVAATKLMEKIAAVLTETRPDEIFLPFHHDGSSEHDAAFKLVAGALDRTELKPRIFAFPVWSWWNPLLLIRPLFTSRKVWRSDFLGYEHIKKKALSAYVSQVEPAPPWTNPVLSGEFMSFFSRPEEFFFEQ